MGSGMSGVVARNYKAGSIVYFEGDKSEYIYILKAGKVVLNYVRPETGEEIKEDIRPGEFFGVKSALGRYPREETAQTQTDCVALQLRLDDFERIVLSNIQLVKKMLRVFSNQLRRIGKAAREVLGETANTNPEAELFKIGEYYFKNGRADQALYAFKKYLEYYPNTQFSQMSMQRIRDIQSGNFTAAPEEPISISAPSAATADVDFGNDQTDGADAFSAPLQDEGPSDMVDFDFDDKPAQSSGGFTDLGNEIDSFLQDDGGGMDSFAEPSLAPKMNNGRSMISSGNFADALEIFSAIRSDAAPGSMEERELWEEASFQVAVCHYNLGKLKESLTELSGFLKNNPQSKFAKNAYLYCGYVMEKAGNRDKAVPYYNKVVSIPPKDDIVSAAAGRLKAMGL